MYLSFELDLLVERGSLSGDYLWFIRCRLHKFVEWFCSATSHWMPIYKFALDCSFQDGRSHVTLDDFLLGDSKVNGVLLTCTNHWFFFSLYPCWVPNLLLLWCIWKGAVHWGERGWQLPGREFWGQPGAAGRLVGQPIFRTAAFLFTSPFPDSFAFSPGSACKTLRQLIWGFQA